MTEQVPDWTTRLDDTDLFLLGKRVGWDSDLKVVFRNAVKAISIPGDTTSTDSDRSEMIKKVVLNELRCFLCTNDKKYQDLRQKLASQGSNATVILVAMIASAISQHAGIAAGALVVMCSTALAALRQVGINAFCAYLSEVEKEEI